MHAHEGGALRVIESQKIDEGLRENIVLGNVEPCLIAHLIFRMHRLSADRESGSR